MSNRHQQQPEASSSLRARIADIFMPSSSSGSSTSGRNHGHDDTHREAPSDRTRLLDGYDRRESVCGQTECNHGTFSPRPEHQQEPRSESDSYAWGRFMNSGAQTTIIEGPASTNRLATDIGMKRRQKLYDHRIKSDNLFQLRLICPVIVTFFIIFHSSTGLFSIDGNFFEVIL